MKKIALLLTLFIIFVSCEKDNFIAAKDIPLWLQANINHEEQIIRDSPALMNSYGAWLRYNWQNVNYYEYHNILSSSLPQPISEKGDTLHIYAGDINTDYYKEKCCKKYVWKAPDYKESF